MGDTCAHTSDAVRGARTINALFVTEKMCVKFGLHKFIIDLSALAVLGLNT